MVGDKLGTTTVLDAAIGAGLQAGAPVAIVNPGAILGPDDPYLGEGGVVRDVVRGRLPTWPRGALQWVDVRDTADVVVAALDRPGRRYLVPGETVALPHETLRVVTGRRLPAVRLPVEALLPALPGRRALARRGRPHQPACCRPLPRGDGRP